MEKMDLANNDGSQFLISPQDEEESIVAYPIRSYFEIEVAKAGNIALIMKSEEDTLVYDALSGDLLHLSSGKVYHGMPLLSQSVVGVNVWTLKTHEGKLRSLVDILVDGREAFAKPISLDGSNLLPFLFLEPETTAVMVNLGDDDDRPFKHDPGKQKRGNCNYNFGSIKCQKYFKEQIVFSINILFQSQKLNLKKQTTQIVLQKLLPT